MPACGMFEIGLLCSRAACSGAEISDIIPRVAISRSRSNAWKHISSRHHTIQRVFVNDKDGCDLMLLGSIRMEFRNSKVVELQFTGRLVVRAESKAGENPRLELMQVFAVCCIPEDKDSGCLLVISSLTADPRQ